MGPCSLFSAYPRSPALVTHITVQPPLRLPGRPDLWSTLGMSTTSSTSQELCIHCPCAQNPPSADTLGAYDSQTQTLHSSELCP